MSILNTTMFNEAPFHLYWRTSQYSVLTFTPVLSLVILRHERRLHKQSWISLEDFFVLRSFRAPIGRNKRAELSVPRRPIFPRNNSTGTISGTTQQEPPNNSAISYFFKDIKIFVIFITKFLKVFCDEQRWALLIEFRYSGTHRISPVPLVTD